MEQYRDDAIATFLSLHLRDTERERERERGRELEEAKRDGLA